MQVCDHEIRLISSRDTIRRNFEHNHITVYIWENVLREYGPPYIVFQGHDYLCKPAWCLEPAYENRVWAGWSESGYMDEVCYMDFRRRFIGWIRACHGPGVPILEIVDNHYSYLDPDQLFTSILNDIHQMTGPGHLTNFWQINDDLVNKLFHDYLRQSVTEHTATFPYLIFILKIFLLKLNIYYFLFLEPKSSLNQMW